MSIADGVIGRFLIGAVVSTVVALFAWRRGSLSSSGAIAAVGIGTVITVGGGGSWLAALLAFFATSTALGRVGRARKETTKREFSKGDRRDAWQALSNGGVAAAAALGMAIAPSPVWMAAFLGALATANGDTWATELGVLSRRDPISLVRLRRVPRGTSGAVSALGLGATVAGAALIGAVAALGARVDPARLLGIVALSAVAGTLGALVDSLLGATLQARFRCPDCARDTEGAVHHCGASTEHVGGVRWLGNDVVNLVATLAGAGFAVVAVVVVGGLAR